MYELIKITENDYYVDCPAKIGIVKIGEKEVVLIDSGSDKDAGKKVLRILEENGWTLKAIFNTHSHADHVGGNKLLQERTGCKIYASGIESAYASNTLLEPVTLYGGLPMKDLQHKFLMASCSNTEKLTEAVLPFGMEILPLSGHSPEMVGFLTKDKTAYIADSVASTETLEKYGIGYNFDPLTAKKSLEYVKTVNANRFVPSHAEVTGSITEIADKNITAIDNVFATVLSFCGEGITYEKLLQKVFDKYKVFSSLQQYALIGSTVRSYLSNLIDGGSVVYEFRDNELFYKKAE